MKIKMLLSAIALSVLAASCGSDDNVTPIQEKYWCQCFPRHCFCNRSYQPRRQQRQRVHASTCRHDTREV